MPPISVPHAIPAIAGLPSDEKSRASETPPIIDPRLKKLDDMAGTKNLPLVLSIPMTTAARATNIRKGNMIRVR